MFGSSGNGFRILSSTVKAVAVIGGLSYAAAHWLSAGGLDQSGLARLAGNIANEPLTTGSINSVQAGAKLDPCAITRK